MSALDPVRERPTAAAPAAGQQTAEATTESHGPFRMIGIGLWSSLIGIRAGKMTLRVQAENSGRLVCRR